ncbi:serine hydrolase-like protein [Lycorma delicatula]|uniref:serine hydrolase-like protein n=1 Tax=Lycorma delicatula TaxID=130591 RepID=UPI003F50FC5C
MASKEFELTFPWGIICGKTWGDPNSLPILMVHGLQDNADSFDNLIQLLPKNSFYYICIDLPGHGKSSHFPQGFSFVLLNYVETIKRIVDHLKLEKFYYIGHSFGGHLGTFFTGLFNDRVIKLVIIDTLFESPIPYELTSEFISDHMNRMIQLEEKLLLKTAPVYKYDEALKRTIAGRNHVLSEAGAKTLLQRSLKKIGNGYRFSADQRLKLSIPYILNYDQQKNIINNIKCPFLLISAFDSLEVVTKVKKYHCHLFEDVKNFKYYIVEGNHSVHIDHPENVAPLISEFLLSGISHL